LEPAETEESEGSPAWFKAETEAEPAENEAEAAETEYQPGGNRGEPVSSAEPTARPGRSTDDPVEPASAGAFESEGWEGPDDWQGSDPPASPWEPSDAGGLSREPAVLVGVASTVSGLSDWAAQWAARRLDRRRMPLVIAAIAVVAAGLGVWWAFGTRDRSEGPETVEAAPGALVTEGSPTTTATEPAVDAEPGDGSTAAEVDPPAESALPYSVLIASYSSLDDALRRQSEWGRTDLPFYVAPTTVRGVVYYRVFAGLLPTRDEAVAVMDELVRRGVKDTARSWDVRPARLAFAFGTYPDAERAREVADSLGDRGVPAYVVGVAGETGAAHYRVYAGGYESREDARPLRDQIDRSGLQTELVERVGVIAR
jgi:cell division septation protein DedD